MLADQDIRRIVPVLENAAERQVGVTAVGGDHGVEPGSSAAERGFPENVVPRCHGVDGVAVVG